MDDDDFDVPQTAKKAKVGKTLSTASTTSGASSVASSKDSKNKLCGYGACDCECKPNRRHCHAHHRHLDNARNPIVKAKGAEAAKAWSEKCRDLEFANSQTEYMAKRAVAHGMFARSPLIDWVAWEQEFGQLITHKQAEELQPFEEMQWVLRQVRKYGRDRDEMAQEWTRKLAGPWRRDNNGYKGALRLWLPAKEMEEKATTKYIKANSLEVSKQKKVPKQWELEAFRAHTNEVGFNHGHAFFGGGAGAEPDCSDDDAETAALAGCADPGDGSEAGTAVEKKVSPLKRKAFEALTLDGSEDENEIAENSKRKSKKPRKGANLTGARAALFDNLSKQLSAKVASIESRLKEAETAQEEEKKAPSPQHATDVTTRQLYRDALSGCLKMVRAWQDVASFQAEVQSFNEDAKKNNKEAECVATDIPDSILTQSPVLHFALKQFGGSIGLERPMYLRTLATMQSHVQSISQCDLDDNTLSRARLLWKRMFACVTQLESAMKKATTDVTKHVAALAAAGERAEKRRKEKEAKDAEAAHFAVVKAKVKQATAEGAAMPGILKLESTDLQPMKVVTGNALPADLDLSIPMVLKESNLQQSWSSHAVVLQVMKNFGSRYKKSDSFMTTGKVNQPFVAKAGKEQTEKFMGDCVWHLQEAKKILDVSEFAANWMTTSWMFGMSPKMSFIGFAPNCAACLRCLSYGEMDVTTVRVDILLQKLKEIGSKVPSKATELEEAWLSCFIELAWQLMSTVYDCLPVSHVASPSLLNS